MAHHLYLERVWEKTQQDLTLPHGEYYGFAIGPQSDLGYVNLYVPGSPMPQPLQLVAGAVIPCRFPDGRPYTGQPRVGDLVKFGLFGVPIVNRLHIIGLTDPSELACAIKRAPDRTQYLQTTKGAGSTTTWLVCFHNRQHGLFIVNSSAIVTLGFYGRSYQQAPPSTVPGRTGIQTGLSVAVGDNSFHIGGTDHEEPFDTLEVEFTGANASDLFAISHIGGEFAR